MARTLDFSNIEKRDFSPLEPGKYELEIEAVEDKVSSKGNDMMVVTFKEPNSGKKIWNNYTFTDSSMFKVQELLDAVGIDTSAVVDFDNEDLIGVGVLAEVSQEEYNGKTRNRIERVYPL